MSRRTLCDPPAGWAERIQELGSQDPPIDGSLLLSVELALELAYLLGLTSETPLVVPALLSGTPLHGINRTPEERLAIANVRQITPYSASSAWRTDLAAYRLLPNEWRHYNFDPLDTPSPDTADAQGEAPGEPDEERENWEKRLLCVARKPEGERRHEAHTRLYHKCLTTRLPFHERSGELAGADKVYRFVAHLPGGEREEAMVTFPQALLDGVDARRPPWFDREQERSREPVFLHLQNDLGPVARFFDQADQSAGRPSLRWEGRLEKIRYQPVDASGTVNPDQENVIALDGFHHAAGMVASGKSTLAFLIAGFIAKNHPQKRATLIVGDNQTVLRLVNQLNRYFSRDPETDVPVAVPLMGRTTRAKHLRDFYASADWHAHQEQNLPHWGERFLSPTCPLQGLIEPNEIALRFGGQTIVPGREPCGSLVRPKPPQAGRRPGDEEAGRTRYLCPLWAQCPSHRATHDMFHAPIWITTPQAMTQGSLPRQAETRPVHIGEVVYEQSDIVIVDEADAVMGVWDETFAQDEDLTNGKPVKGGRGDGIYDRLGGQTERFVIPHRASLTSGQLRWSQAQRGGQNASQVLLSLLNDSTLPFLHQWVERDYFTPYDLFYRLSRRIAGLSEEPPRDESPADKQRTSDCLEPFDLLFGRRTPDALNPRRIRAEHERRQRLPQVERDEPAYELWQILRDIDTEGDRIFHPDEVMLGRCKTWITETFGQCEAWGKARQERLRQEARAAAEQAKSAAGKEAKRRARRLVKRKEGELAQGDTLDTLAYRLLFVLVAALLDRHTYVVLAEWGRRTAPDESDVQPHQKTPASLRDVLPLPPLGRQFGTYYSPGGSGTNPNRLSFLSYTNIGRWYLLHFHELFSDLRQRPGPHVLALSGTSYLPDAVRLHLGSQCTCPQGLLLPEAEAIEGIRQSEFTFLPLRDAENAPIRISGAKEGADKMAALETLTRRLTGYRGGYLQQERDALQGLGATNAKHWADRARILLLVNSYEQAQAVATTLQEVWPEERERIFYLSRVEGEKYDALGGGRLGRVTAQTALNRPDIETFGTSTNGHILVAPLSAIGRGYNILNRQGQAAFGSLYFLIRPYPHPDDMTALAREMNRRTLDWADDAEFVAWSEPSLEAQFQKLRQTASHYWDAAGRRQYWSTLHDYPEWGCAPRKDLAAYTAGLLVQAAGRLLRGGVPFRAYFVDAAFAPLAAHHPDETPVEAMPARDAPYNSLLAAVIVLLRDLVNRDALAKALYEPLADALCDTRFRDGKFPFDDHWNAPEKNHA